jgi:CheY-like chemotaxis protein
MLYTVSKDNTDVMDLPDDGEANIICENQNRKVSVLVADGDDHTRNELTAITDKMGYAVAVANNDEEALDLFLKRSLDLVFTALKMPGMDGLTLRKQTCEKNS